MKKFKIFSILLLIASTSAFVVFKVYMKVIVDNVAPVVTCESAEIEVPVEITEEELLAGVTAEDNRSGDVTDTLVIEKMSAFSDEGKRVVTYAAVDDSMNVGRCEQTIIYKGYERPRFDMSSSLCYSVGSNVDFLAGISAESVLDGSLTENIKYSLEGTVNITEPGSYPIEFRVMDSGGNVVYLDTSVEICEIDKCAFDVYLKKYLVYINKGDKFDPEKYYEGAEYEDGSLKIDSNVNTKKTGTYYVDYIVKGASVSGRARLVVVVE